MKNIHFDIKVLPLAFLLVLLIAFGPIIPWLGLYWDDWPSLWFLHFFGPSRFPDVFTIDRPLLGGLFVITTSLVGESLIAWQIFGILTRLMSALAFGWLLNLLWSGRRFQTTSMVLLFLIYPGFKQQFIPITYSQVFVVLSIFFLSLGTMILAYRGSRWFWPLVLVSIGTSALCMFTVEYYVGLELLRPVLLWLTLKPKGEIGLRQRLQKVGLRWLPYVALLGIFVLWRGSNETPRGTIIIFNELRADPFLAIVNLSRTVLQDVIEASLVAWGQTLNLSPLFETKWFVVVIYCVTFVLTTALTIVLLARLRLEGSTQDGFDPKADRLWALEAIGLGLYALLVGGWPIWVTDLRIDLVFPWDRFTLLLMAGACILFVGLVELLIHRRRLLKVVILGLAVGFAAGSHFLVAMTYRQDWSFQKPLFWQMVWRMPGLEPGTTLMTPELPFLYVTDNSLTAPLNWTYSPGEVSLQLPYLMLNLDARLGLTLDDLKKDQSIYMPYRWPEFNGSTSQVVLIYYDPPRCLKVLDPELDDLWPNKPHLLSPEALRLSNPDFIHMDAQPAAQPPTHIFGPEPEPDWCYYFEKAELARQGGDFQAIVPLGERALELGKEFTKETAPELVPFIEGYGRTGRWDMALELSLESDRHAPKVKYLLCELWQNMYEASTPTPEGRAAYDKLQRKLQCDLP